MNRFFTLLFAASCLTAVGQVPDYVPTDGLVGWWPLNGDAVEAFSGSLNGENFGAALEVDRFGVSGGALQFVDDTLIVSGGGQLPTGSDSRSMSFWLQSSMISAPSNRDVLGWGTQTTLGRFGFTLYDGYPYFVSQNADFYGNEFIGDGSWHHICLTYDGEVVRMYIDGNLDESEPKPLATTNDGPLVVGRSPLQHTGLTYYDGGLDDLGIWDRSLTQIEVSQLFSGPATLLGCTDSTACNFNPDANVEDGTCHWNCQFCHDGTIWDESLFKCVVDEASCGWQPDGNGDDLIGVSDLLDLLGVYGDTDYDQDGIWDSADECVGEYDECGVCNGSGPSIPIIESIEILYDSVYAEQIDAWYVFEVGADTTYQFFCGLGCTDPLAENYNESADTDDGSCVYPWACGDPLEYQGYDYETVQIGEQCWFAENLRAENYRNGEVISANLDAGEWDIATSGAVAVYGNDASNLETYGRLYNWFAVDDARGLCPADWYVPLDSDWTELAEHLGGLSVAGCPMKTTIGWSEDGNGSNSSFFAGLPGGTRYGTTGVFNNEGTVGLWWSLTPSSPYPWSFYLSSSNCELERTNSDYNQQWGHSVRCIKDTE